MRQIVNTTGRKRKPRCRHIQTTGICNRHHFNRAFCAIQKGIEHLRVHTRRPRLIRGQTIVIPNVIRGDSMINRQIFSALTRRRDVKPRGPRPIHHFRNQSGLIAIGHRITNARCTCLLRKEWAHHHVRFYIDHDHMFARLNRGKRMFCARARVSRGLDHHIHIIPLGQFCAAFLIRQGIDARRVPSHSCAGRNHTRMIQFGDCRHLNPCDCGHLGQKHRPKLTRPNQSNANGTIAGCGFGGKGC